MRIRILILSIFLSQLASGQPTDDNYLKARSLMLMQNYDSAVYFLNLAETSNPGNTDVIYNKGLCSFELKRYDDAISNFLIVNKRKGGMASLMLAKTEARLNHQELAVKYLREHLSSFYKKPEKDILLDADLARLETSVAWKSLWKEREWYNKYDKQLQEVVYLESTGENLDAINILNELNEKGYKRTLVNQYLADIYLSSGNKKAAMDALDKSIKADTRNMESLKKRVDLYCEEGEFEKAKTDCGRLLRQAPDEFEYYLISGKINVQLGNYDQALENVEFYLRFYPRSENGYNTLGEIYYDQGKYLKALPTFNKALELNSGSARSYFNRGRTYAATKTFKYAERDLSMSLDLDPSDSEVWFTKGLVDMELGNNEIACFDFKKALQYGKYEARTYIEQLCGR